MTEELRVRCSVRELQTAYEAGDTQPLEDLLRAWKGIKDLPPTDPNSFFVLGGYHGEPFDYRDSDRLYWGGYCNHGNVLFPTWHRVYVYKLENALRTIVPNVTMPYWDETSDETLALGIPWVLTQQTVTLEGNEIDNPLRSFVLPEALSDELNQRPQGNVPNLYAKPAGYETVRYPLSGLVGTELAQDITRRHNLGYPDPEENTEFLNRNVIAWLNGNAPTVGAPDPQGHGVYWMYNDCLRAPNYTVFSNSTSAAAWSKESGGVQKALEDPHNDVHIAIGGLDALGTEFGQMPGANGDMGENNTAALDPIFFFHHCNVDRMFWLWQQQTGHTDGFDIIDGYPGANSNASQGPTTGYDWDTPLTLESPLYPFKKDDGSDYISTDVFNPETQLGVVYTDGSLSGGPVERPQAAGMSTQKLTVSSIDRSLFEGSFVLVGQANVTLPSGEAKHYNLGHHTVLSRGNVTLCANCLTHLEVVAHFSLAMMPADEVEHADFSVQVRHRGRQLPNNFALDLAVHD